jgi:hypothetical protein
MGVLEDKLDEIKKLKWSEEDEKVMIKVMKNAIFYRRLLSKTFETDLIKCVDICIREKKLLESFMYSLKSSDKDVSNDESHET